MLRFIARDFLFHLFGSLPAEGPGSEGDQRKSGVIGAAGIELLDYQEVVNLF